jgi:hypothetical protein
MALFEWSDKPATKKDLITHLITLGVALWLVDSGEGAKGLEALQSKVRGLLNAAPAEEKKPDEAAK